MVDFVDEFVSALRSQSSDGTSLRNALTARGIDPQDPTSDIGDEAKIRNELGSNPLTTGFWQQMSAIEQDALVDALVAMRKTSWDDIEGVWRAIDNVLLSGLVC